MTKVCCHCLLLSLTFEWMSLSVCVCVRVHLLVVWKYKCGYSTSGPFEHIVAIFGSCISSQQMNMNKSMYSRMLALFIWFAVCKIYIRAHKMPFSIHIICLARNLLFFCPENLNKSLLCCDLHFSPIALFLYDSNNCHKQTWINERWRVFRCPIGVCFDFCSVVVGARKNPIRKDTNAVYAAHHIVAAAMVMALLLRRPLYT